MDRRTWLGTISGIVIGGLTAGPLVWYDQQAKIKGEVEKRHEWLTFDERISFESREIELEPQQYFSTEVGVAGNSGIPEEPKQFKYRVTADTPIDLLHLPIDQFLKYREGEDWSAIPYSSSPNTTHASASGIISRNFSRLVVDNTSEGVAKPVPAPVSVDVEVEIWQ